MSHSCHAIECEKSVAPAMFMCKKHWYMVPPSYRQLIWKHYRPGQERGDAGVTQEYCEAAKKAIREVALREARTIVGNEPELLLYDMLITEEPAG